MMILKDCKSTNHLRQYYELQSFAQILSSVAAPNNFYFRPLAQNYMRRFNNKIRAKHQTTFLTQTDESILINIEKRSKSLNPQSSNKAELYQGSFEDISQRISFLKPFSHYQKKGNLNDQLNEVVSEFKKLSKKNLNPLSTSYQKKYIDSSYKNSIRQYKGEVRQILMKSTAKTSKNQKKNTLNQISRSKTVQQTYEDVENQSANNLIIESRRENKQFKKTMDKFNTLIHDASATFIESWNINLKPRKIKEMKINQLLNFNSVNQKYKDQVYFYEEQTISKSKGKYNFGKEIGMFLKSMNKVMNTQQNKEQKQVIKTSQNCKMLRANHKRIKSLNNDEQKGFSNYFQSKKSKRELIKASIPAPLINNSEVLD